MDLPTFSTLNLSLADGIADPVRGKPTSLPDVEVIQEPTPLAAATIPLVGGLKRVPIRFTPTRPVGGP